MSLKSLFSVLPVRTLSRLITARMDEEYRNSWYNACFERDWTRVILKVGDLAADGERESGEFAGPCFGATLLLAQEDTGEFYLPERPTTATILGRPRRYDTYSLVVMVWRWGVYVSVRGRVYQ